MLVPILAESPYEQWRRLHNILLDDIQENREFKSFQSKKRRMFKLELTDGYKTVNGMEYVTIPGLSKKTSPGTKIQIVGPVQVVNHIILLEPKNVKILGGDVDHLLVVNAYENILLKALDKPTTETPITEFVDEAPVIETQRERLTIETKPMTNTSRSNVSSTPAPVNDLLDGIDFTEEDDVDMEMLMQIEQEERRYQENPTEINQNEAMEVDEYVQLNNQQVLSTEVIEVQDEVPRKFVKATDLLIPPIIIPDEDEDQEIYFNDLLSRPSSSHQLSDDPVPRKIARVEPTRVASFTSDDYRFKSSDGYNLVTIDQYLTMKATDKIRREYFVWGKVISVPMASLRIKNLEWQLFGNLGDSYSHQPLPVKFHNEILEKLSGFTGAEMKKMYSQAKTKPQVKDDILKIVEGLRNKIVANLQFMRIKIEFAPDHDGPSNYELTEILEPDEVSRQTFMTKLKEENIKTLE